MALTQFAPPTESYIPPPAFEFSATQKETDFAQFISIGTLDGEALLRASIITTKEFNELPEDTLLRMAYKLKRSKGVSERIRYFRILHTSSMSTTLDRMKQEASAITYADFSLLFDDEGVPYRNPHDIPRHVRAAIKEWSWDEKGNMRFKFHDKMKSMQMLGDLEGHFDKAHAAKAPQINITLGDGGEAPKTIDVTPTTDDTTPTPNLPECLL